MVVYSSIQGPIIFNSTGLSGIGFGGGSGYPGLFYLQKYTDKVSEIDATVTGDKVLSENNMVFSVDPITVISPEPKDGDTVDYVLPIGTYSIFSKEDTVAYYDSTSANVLSESVAVVLSFASETEVTFNGTPKVTIVSGDYTGELMPYLATSITTPITANSFLVSDLKDEDRLIDLINDNTIEFAVNGFVRYTDYTSLQLLFDYYLYIENGEIFFSYGFDTYSVPYTFVKGDLYNISFVVQPTRLFLVVNNVVVKLITTEPMPGLTNTSFSFPIGKGRDVLDNIIIKKPSLSPLVVIAEGGEYVITSTDEDVVF